MIDLEQSYAEVEEATSFKPLPNGTYPVQVDSVEEGVSKSSGKKMLTWTFKTFNCDDNSHNGRLMSLYTVLPTEYGDDEMDKNGEKKKSFWASQSLGAIIKALSSDWNPESTESIQFDETDLAPWVGKECNAVVKQEEYEGNINSKIGRLVPG